MPTVSLNLKELASSPVVGGSPKRGLSHYDGITRGRKKNILLKNPKNLIKKLS